VKKLINNIPPVIIPKNETYKNIYDIGHSEESMPKPVIIKKDIQNV